jgi:DNA-directed RNA polymerase subunit beta
MPMRHNPHAGEWQNLRVFGRHGKQTKDWGEVSVPDLTELQTKYYDRFLQLDFPPEKRGPAGLHGIIAEAFPIKAQGTSAAHELRYLSYRLGKPRYTPDECRNLKLTYGAPFHLQLQLRIQNADGSFVDQPPEEVYIGDMPLMIGGGEFIINGAERVIVTQLHRSPGVDFSVELSAGDRKLHSCWVIPERGSWIELYVTKKNSLAVRIDQSGKFSAMTLLRAMWDEGREGDTDALFSSNEEIIRRFHTTKVVPLGEVDVPDHIDTKRVISACLDSLAGVSVQLPSRAGLGEVAGTIRVELPERSNLPDLQPVPTKAVMIDRPQAFEAEPATTTVIPVARDGENALEEMVELLEGYRLAEDVEDVGIEAGHRLTEEDIEKLLDESGAAEVTRIDRVNINRADAEELEWTHERFSSGLSPKPLRLLLEAREATGFFDSIDQASTGIGVARAAQAKWRDIFYVGPPPTMPVSKPPEGLIEELVGRRLAEDVLVTGGKRIAKHHRLTETDIDRIYDTPTIESVTINTKVNLNFTDEDELRWTSDMFGTGLTTDRRVKKLLDRLGEGPVGSLDEAQKGIGLNAAQSRAWDLAFVCGPPASGAGIGLPEALRDQLVGATLADAVALEGGEVVSDGTVLTDDDAARIYAESDVEAVELEQYNLNKIADAETLKKIGAAFGLKLGKAADLAEIVKVVADKGPFGSWDELVDATPVTKRMAESAMRRVFYLGMPDSGAADERLAEAMDLLLGGRLAQPILGPTGKELLPRFLKITDEDVETLFLGTTVEKVELLRPEDRDLFDDQRESAVPVAGKPSESKILTRMLEPTTLDVQHDESIDASMLAGKFAFKTVHVSGRRPVVEAYQVISKKAAKEILELAHRADAGDKKPAEGAKPAITKISVVGYTKKAWVQKGLAKGARTGEEKERLLQQIVNRHTVTDVVDPTDHQVIVPRFQLIVPDKAQQIINSGLGEIEVIEALEDRLILDSLDEDTSVSHEDALTRIYQRLRPGNPPNLEKAKDLFRERFMDESRYKLGRVGRFRLNRKFGSDIDEDVQTLLQEDVANAIEYILKLRNPGSHDDEMIETDDIDHLGNRRVKTIDELAGDELRKGFLKLKKNVQDRMQMDSNDAMTPRGLVNPKTISSAINQFFGRGELSQVVDQTNPLSQLNHERRLSALGPGGLNRKRAGFEVRDVHISHYGRICPIETPEGTNIGLISALAVYSGLDQYGFLTTPYRVVQNRRVTPEIQWLRADQEMDVTISPADIETDEDGNMIRDTVMARRRDDTFLVPADDVQYVDVSPKQLVGVSASLIPFLEHDDANRALMGSNMQRQAVPLLRTEPPRVATGMEHDVARNSGMVQVARRDGVVIHADAMSIEIAGFADVKKAEKVGYDPDQAQTLFIDKYELRKYVGLNERTCLNQKPIVTHGQHVTRGTVIADGAATSQGELALGKNVLVAFMPWDGYNFEDAIIVSEELVQNDVYTSLHIDTFEVEIRETKIGNEEFTREIPHVSEKMRRNLDERGIVRVGTKVVPGDILVGKVAPKSKSELTPEEKLLYAIFGKAGEDVKNDSLEVPSGVEGIVIHTQHFARKPVTSEDDRKKKRDEQKKADQDYIDAFGNHLREVVSELEKLVDDDDKTLKFLDDGKPAKIPAKSKSENELKAIEIRLTVGNLNIEAKKEEKAHKLLQELKSKLDEAEELRFRRINKITRGDELQQGVLEMAKVYVATRRTLSVGDKFAGRHGNKGVVSRILPVEDMPFLEDGTPIQMILNPLGVPSRMNLGQILEIHLGWAAHELGVQAVTPVFDGCSESDLEDMLKEAGLPMSGKAQLYDGRTGQSFDQRTTVGYMYMLKLHHLVDDKVHARATGPYSLITQQPLGGKARFGGQRFGEMEVWALEAYGAAHTLQELLTVKSDDVEGRTKIYESMVKGNNILEPGTPISFDVLTHEIKGLALNMELIKKSVLDALGEDAQVPTEQSADSVFGTP